MDLDLHSISAVSQLFQRLVTIHVMEQISTELDLSPTQYSKSLFLFFFSQVGSFDTADGGALTHADPLFIGSSGYFVEIFREVEVGKEEAWVWLDDRVVEQFHEDLSYGHFSAFDYFGFMTVEPTFFESFFIGDFEIVLIMLLHNADHLIDWRKPHM